MSPRIPEWLRRRWHPLAVVTAAALCVVAYWAGLYGPFVFDDAVQIAPLVDPQTVARQGRWALLFSNSGALGRPVSMLTFLANAVLSGENVFWWKFTNLGIHVLCALVLLQLTRRIAGFAWGSRQDAWWFAGLVALVWAFHPLHVSTVLYTVQRMAQLSTLFTFCGMLAYAHGRILQLDGRGGKGWVVAAFVVCLPLAALSKENGALLPGFTFLMELFLFRFAGTPRQRKGLAGLYAVLLALPAAAVLGVLFFSPDLLLGGFAGREFTLGERALTESRAVMYYIYLLIAPTLGNMGFFHDDFPISHGLLAPPTTLYSLLGIAALLAVCVGLARRRSIVGFGIAFFLAGHVLESTIIPLELVWEHRNYLPSYGLILAVCTFPRLITPARRARVVAATFLIPLLFGFLTHVRAGIWGSGSTLYNYALHAHPYSENAVSTVAEVLSQRGRLDDAFSLLQRIDTNGGRMHRLYVQCLRDGRLSGAELESVTSKLESPINMYGVTGLERVAKLNLEGRCAFSRDEYVKLLDRATDWAVIRNPDVAQHLYLYKAHLLWAEGRADDAMAALEAGAERYGAGPMPLFLAADWSMTLGRLGPAENYYNRAVDVARRSRFSFSEYIDTLGARLQQLKHKKDNTTTQD